MSSAREQGRQEPGGRGEQHPLQLGALLTAGRPPPDQERRDTDQQADEDRRPDARLERPAGQRIEDGTALDAERVLDAGDEADLTRNEQPGDRGEQRKRDRERYEAMPSAGKEPPVREEQHDEREQGEENQRRQSVDPAPHRRMELAVEQHVAVVHRDRAGQELDTGQHTAGQEQPADRVLATADGDEQSHRAEGQAVEEDRRSVCPPGAGRPHLIRHHEDAAGNGEHRHGRPQHDRQPPPTADTFTKGAAEARVGGHGVAPSGGRSHSAAAVGCMVSRVTVSRSARTVSRSTCERSRVRNASTVRAAS